MKVQTVLCLLALFLFPSAVGATPISAVECGQSESDAYLTEFHSGTSIWRRDYNLAVSGAEENCKDEMKKDAKEQAGKPSCNNTCSWHETGCDPDEEATAVPLTMIVTCESKKETNRANSGLGTALFLFSGNITHTEYKCSARCQGLVAVTHSCTECNSVLWPGCAGPDYEQAQCEYELDLAENALSEFQ